MDRLIKAGVASLVDELFVEFHPPHKWLRELQGAVERDAAQKHPASEGGDGAQEEDGEPARAISREAERDLCGKLPEKMMKGGVYFMRWRCSLVPAMHVWA